MAFTFNWQGIRVNPVAGAKGNEAARADAANFGAAVRGYENRKLDKDYAEMVRGRRDMQANVDGIKAEIDRLEARQAEIRAIIGGA